MKIIKAKSEQAKLIAHIVSESNRDVAIKFNLTRDNNPKHPSFYNESWVLSDFDRGEEYFLYESEGIFMGCVAFEHPQPDTAYLNRLSVLPEFRQQGIGAALVRYIIDYSRSKNVSIVSIGIIAGHKVLKAWYQSLGFVEIETNTFDHLPFDVTYLHYRIQ